MTKIYFSINIKVENTPMLVSSNEVLKNIDKYITYIKSSGFKWDYGRLTIKYFSYKIFIEQEESLYLLFHIHTRAIEAILKSETLKSSFQHTEYDCMTFDYVDAKNTGVRIRHYGTKSYRDTPEIGDTLYFSQTDYLKQELILPKQEYMKNMIESIRQYIEYRYIIEQHEGEIQSLNSWKEKIIELEKSVKLL